MSASKQPQAILPAHTRRTFLKSMGAVAGTGGLIAAALQAGAAQAAGPSPAGEKIRIGVAGGRFGASFCWHEHPNCTVAAVTDLRADRLANLVETYHCDQTYESLEKMVLADDIDAVAVFTPAPDHVRHAELVLNSGKHVISAVPAAMNLEECASLIDTVKRTGLTYMMAETSYYVQEVMTARKWFQEGRFGDLFCCEAEYHHDGLEGLWFEDGQWTWRHGFPPMHYPTHSTAMLAGVTGERLTEVSCIGWGDNDPILKGNPYQNPFWSETALFKTDRGHACRIAVYWKVAAGGCERAHWFGDKMSFFMPTPNGMGAVVRSRSGNIEKDSGGFDRSAAEKQDYEQDLWWKTDMLPEPLRHDSGHGGSHTFLTHEFIDSLVSGRRPSIDVFTAVAYTAPGIVAHQSALKGGEQMKVPDFGAPA
jgi:predicted dehydrogenase